MFPPRTTNRWFQRLPVFLLLLCGITSAISTSEQVSRPQQPLSAPEHISVLAADQKPLPANPRVSMFPHLVAALDVLQQDYFTIWQGIWPTSIDWTAAVLGTYLSAALTTLSTSYASLVSEKDDENLINWHFSQLVGAYFGQDIFGLMQQANDDMLWVVLEWLEGIKFINTHSALHYTNPSSPKQTGWYGTQYIPAFSHRARIFYDLASKGWNTTLCDGGMIWSPHLLPYKNAITNELYITASISMYLYFPGDDNTSPFGFSSPDFINDGAPGKPHDPKYLAAAIVAYKWLTGINMTNEQGLYVDGFHISRRSATNSTGKLCDRRNEMVYTYNQGVLLSGVRGLYEATAARSYLEDGHKLVEDVIRATGWHYLPNAAPELRNQTRLGKWHGLGRSGILEDACDATGTCSQDGQTFKGIFFHHLALFCSGLPPYLALPDGYFRGKDLEDDSRWHDSSCSRYAAWIQHNAEAALTTKDKKGRFGMWWGAPKEVDTDHFHPHVELPDSAVDYRNLGVPSQWKKTRRYRRDEKEESIYLKAQDSQLGTLDLNDRGRGRTVETQGGGVAILMAAWELAEKK
jgi:hypothetical protein